MKSIVITLALLSTSAFAAGENIKCFSQYRSLVKAHKSQIQSTDAVADYGVYAANFVDGIAVELMAQSDRRVGSYGHYLRNDAKTLLNTFTRLNSITKSKEAVVEEEFVKLENCLLGLEETSVDPQPEQI